MALFMIFISPSIAYLSWDKFPRLARLFGFVAVIEVVGISIHLW